MMMKCITKTAEETQALAEKIGSQLKGGECIELTSDVGGGKTTFVKGLVRGAGSKNHVSSPTFTISKVYDAPKFKIVHFDFYRLTEPGLIENEIEESIDDSHSVIVVEWSDIIQHVLPQDRLTVRIASIDEHQREISISVSPKLAYLTDQIVP